MQGFFDGAQVGQTELGLNHFNIGNGVYFARHVNDVGVFKAAHHIHGGVGFADVRQKLIAQPLSGAGTRHQTGNVHKLHNGWHDALGHHNGGELLQACVGHFHNAHIGLNGAKGVVFSRNARFGEGIEQGGFTDVGQTNNAAFQAHRGSYLKVSGKRRPDCSHRPNGRCSLGDGLPHTQHLIHTT